MVRLLLIIFCLWVCSLSLPAQCPDKNLLWHRIVYLRDSSKVSLSDQKKELLQYLAKINACPVKSDSTVALLLQRIGWLFSAEKDFARAIQFSKQSIDVVSKNIDKATVNYAHVIKTYNNLRILYDSCGQQNLSMKAMDSSIAIGLRLSKGYEYVMTLLPTRTFSYIEAGDYYKCIEFCKLGETLSKSLPAYSSYAYYFTIWRMDALIFLGRFEEALQELNTIIPAYKKSGSKEFLGSFFGLAAIIYEKKGDEKNALANLKQSIYYNTKSKNFNVIAQSLNNVGYDLYFKNLKQYNTALNYYSKALAFTEPGQAVYLYNNIANVYVAKKIYDSAFYFFQKGFDEINQGTNEQEFLTNPELFLTQNVEYVFNLVLDKADGYLDWYKSKNNRDALGHAITIYERAESFFERINKDQYDIQSKLFWREQTHRLYEHAIEACLFQNDKQSAFYFFERSRAALLRNELQEQQWIGQEEILHQSQLKKRLQAKEKELSFPGISSDNYKVLQTEIFNYRQDLNKLESEIKQKIPLYYQNFVDSSFLTIKDVRQTILQDHDAIIEIFSGDSAIYLLMITKKDIAFQKINKSLFDRLSLAFTRYISRPDALNQNFKDFTAVSNQLYKLLFQNVNPPSGRIIISPDQGFFPFESLVTNTKPLTYFLDNHAVSYTYSAGFLKNNFTNNTDSKKTFLGMAPVNFHHLPDLSGSDQSLNNVQHYFDNMATYTGNNATKNNFLNEFYKYKIIQLYTHATDSGYTGEPMIYFSDSVLNISDLFPEKKPASELIVLSACETALGKVYVGEGVFSFNRSFAALGIPSTVSNLWQANDQATYKLTELFYKYVAEELPLDVALQKAKKDLMENAEFSEYRLPYYWASSILVGKTDAITFQKSFPLKWIASLLLVALLFIGGWRMRKKSLTSRKIQNPHERGL